MTHVFTIRLMFYLKTIPMLHQWMVLPVTQWCIDAIWENTAKSTPYIEFGGLCTRAALYFLGDNRSCGWWVGRPGGRWGWGRWQHNCTYCNLHNHTGCVQEEKLHWNWQKHNRYKKPQKQQTIMPPRQSPWTIQIRLNLLQLCMESMQQSQQWYCFTRHSRE